MVLKESVNLFAFQLVLWVFGTINFTSFMSQDFLKCCKILEEVFIDSKVKY